MAFALNFKKILVGFLLVAFAIGAYLYITTPKAQALESLDNINAGDLFRGESFSAVYFMGADGFRYVFPNQNTFDTWFDNFDGVKFISDGDLGKIQIGGNVTYRPGVKMIKINTDPKTYAVAKGGVLRHVTTEQVAIDLYGASWNTMIHDMPDGFFTNYEIGSAINSSGEFSVSGETTAATSINADKNLKAPAEISITDNGYSPLDATIGPGDSVRFTNNGSVNHTVTGDDLSWGSGTMTPGQSYFQTFDDAGEFPFFDSYDSGNTGAVFVQ